MKSEVSIEFTGRDALVAEFVALAAVDHALASQRLRPEVGLLLQENSGVYLHNLIVARMRILKGELGGDPQD